MTDKADKYFEITVDGEEIEVPRKNTTPTLILELAGIDPKERYLIQITGQNKESYKDNPEQEIHVHENQIFVTGKLGAVAVA